MTLIDLGGTFKSARLRRRLTQEDAARAAGVSPLLVSQFERGALRELGTVKLLALFQVVGLELVARPAGQERTLDDIARELDVAETTADPAMLPKRVRRSRAERT
jgi:transcriptional regulator with XRE-family HTH domain